jgi:lysozyme
MAYKSSDYRDFYEMTKLFEGFRDKPYMDTKNNKTIGYGFNLGDKTVRRMIPSDVAAGTRPLDRESAESIYAVLRHRAMQDAIAYVGNDTFKSLPTAKKAVLIDMAYNLGGEKLAGFKDMKAAILKGDFRAAANEMKNSNWWGQVGNRAPALQELMLSAPDHRQGERF